MLKAYAIHDGTLSPIADAGDLKAAAWIDLWQPTPEEIAAAEKAYGARIELPDPTDRFYVADQVEAAEGQVIMRALLLAGVDQRTPTLIPITFIHTRGGVITISRGSPDGLCFLVSECQQGPQTSEQVFPAILDMVVDHATSMLDHIGSDLDKINIKLFQHRADPTRRRKVFASPRHRTRQLEAILTELGYQREVLMKLRRSVVSFRRLIGLLRERGKAQDLAAKLREFEHELLAIAEAQVDLSNTATFMLDGAVGFITILQSNTINIMTIVGILLTPPVLIASIYGMNFKHMPELDWQWGYGWALGLMLVSTVVVLLLVRARGWL